MLKLKLSLETKKERKAVIEDYSDSSFPYISDVMFQKLFWIILGHVSLGEVHEQKDFVVLSPSWHSSYRVQNCLDSEDYFSKRIY